MWKSKIADDSIATLNRSVDSRLQFTRPSLRGFGIIEKHCHLINESDNIARRLKAVSVQTTVAGLGTRNRRTRIRRLAAPETIIAKSAAWHTSCRGTQHAHVMGRKADSGIQLRC